MEICLEWTPKLRTRVYSPEYKRWVHCTLCAEPRPEEGATSDPESDPQRFKR
jgi:hypothetical protein